MKFRNDDPDAQVLPALGITVEPGDEFVLTADEAEGLVGQCVPGGKFSPVDDDAKAAVKAATAPKDPAKKAAPRKATAPKENSE